MSKNVQTIVQLRSFNMLTRYCSIPSSKASEWHEMRTSRCTGELSDGFRKGRGTRNQTANICWIIEKASKFQKNIYFCFTDYAKPFDCAHHNKLWRSLKRQEYQNTLSASWQTCMQKQQLEVDMEQWTGSKLGKEYVKAVYIRSPWLFKFYAK